MKCTLAPLGSQGGFKATPNRPKSSHLHRNGIYIFDFFKYFVCICAATYLWPVSLIFSVGFAFHSFLSYFSALQSRAQHSKAEQRTATPPAKRGGPATHTAQLRTLEDNTHIAQHGTAQPCSTARSREVQHIPLCPQSTPEHGVLPALPNHILESFMYL